MKESVLFAESNADIEKYFLHGWVLSVVMLGLNLTFQFLFTLTDPIIIIIGFIVAFVFFFISIGTLNSEFVYRIWHITTQGYWLDQLAHGFLLSIFLYVFVFANYFLINYLLIYYQFFLFLYLFATFFGYAIIAGFLGRRVAEIFEIKSSDIVQMRSKSIKGRCPHCNQDYFYTESSISKQGFVMCMNCSKRFQIRGKDDTSYLEID